MGIFDFFKRERQTTKFGEILMVILSVPEIVVKKNVMMLVQSGVRIMLILLWLLVEDKRRFCFLERQYPLTHILKKHGLIWQLIIAK